MPSTCGSFCGEVEVELAAAFYARTKDSAMIPAKVSIDSFVMSFSVFLAVLFPRGLPNTLFNTVLMLTSSPLLTSLTSPWST